MGLKVKPYEYFENFLIPSSSVGRERGSLAQLPPRPLALMVVAYFNGSNLVGDQLPFEFRLGSAIDIIEAFEGDLLLVKEVWK